MLVGLNGAPADARSCRPPSRPAKRLLGSLCHYLVETNPKHFSPMNSNWGRSWPELARPP